MPTLVLATLLTMAPPDSMVVSPAWLQAHRADPDLVVLHVSMERDDYLRGHVPGARWVNPHDFFTNDAPGVELPPVERLDSLVELLGITAESRIVYYGDTWMAPRVFLALDYLGLGDRAALLDGGLPAWRKAGYDLSTATPTWLRSRFTPSVRGDIVIDARELAASRSRAGFHLVDGRSPGEYTGEDKRERLPRSGHIPGGINLPWERTFTDPMAALDGTPSPLQEVGALRKLFAEAGVGNGAALVTYCTVGLRASHLYFIARYLGLHPRIYDGSMSEWSRKPELPMATGASPR